MNAVEFENIVLGLINTCVTLPPSFYEELKATLPQESTYIEPNNFASIMAFLIRVNVGRQFDQMSNFNEQLNIAIAESHSRTLNTYSKRSMRYVSDIADYSSRDLSNKDRGILIGRLYSVLFEHLDYAYNLVQLKNFLGGQTNNASNQYYINLRLLSARYFGVSQYGISLFDTLLAQDDTSLRTPLYNNAATRLDLKNILEIISDRVKYKLDEVFGGSFRQKRIIQVVSSGRCGTYFLRNQLLNYAENVVPIHNVYTIPSLNVRSLLSIIQLHNLSESDFVLPIGKEQLSILATHLEHHLFVFCIELLAYMNRFHKVPVIINHWWSPFVFLLKSIFPNLEFLSLTRDRDSVMYSMVEKYQIYTNPMPPQLFFSNYESSEEDKTVLNDWSDYFLDLTDQLQLDVARIFPDSCHGSISLTPPNEEAADRLIQIFNLNCNSQSIIDAPIANHKEKI